MLSVSQDGLLYLEEGVIICLNGYKLQFQALDGGDAFVRTRGDLTLCSCRSDTPYGYGKVCGMYSFDVAADSTLTLSEITFETGQRIGSTASNRSSKLIMSSSVICSGNSQKASCYLTDVNIGGGEFLADLKSDLVSLEVSGGKVQGEIPIEAGDTFEMSGGEISGCGGVKVNGGTLTMSGGKICGNSAEYGGGVSVNGGTFTMNGGCFGGELINSGGSVAVTDGRFAQMPDEEQLADNYSAHDISMYGGADFDENFREDFPYVVYENGAAIAVTAGNIVYDGSPVQAGVDLIVEGADGEALTWLYSVNGGSLVAGLPTNAGNYTVCVVALNEARQFLSAQVGITIAKATDDMTGITFADSSFAYDGQAHGIEIEGVLPDGVTVNYTGNDMTDLGEYTVTATFAGDFVNYYAIDAMTAKLTIVMGTYDMSGITFAYGSFIYDGQTHGIEIEGVLPDGVDVSYIENYKINVGEYDVIAVFEGDYDNYYPIDEMTAKLTIVKATPIYTAPTGLTANTGDILADVELPAGWTWKDEVLQLVESGEYKAVAVYTPEDTENYNTVEVELTLTVTQPEPEVTPDGGTGQPIIIVASVVGTLVLAYGVFALLYKKKIVSGVLFEKIYPFIKP